jgi:hypothetical protein
MTKLYYAAVLIKRKTGLMIKKGKQIDEIFIDSVRNMNLPVFSPCPD